MKNFLCLVFLFVAILLFFVKESRAQCDSRGIIAHSESGDTYQLFFSKQPWTDCASMGLGWQQPDSISTHWIITNDDCDTLIKVATLPKDTIYFKGDGFIYVTAEVTYHYIDAPTKTSVPAPIWFEASGQSCLFVLPPAIDTTTLTPIDTTVVTPPTILPENSLSVDGGIISASGVFGVLKVYSYPSFAPLALGFIEFQDSLIFSLSQVFGIGKYYVECLFVSPYEDLSLGVVEVK